jgi:hypothetical protein
MLQTDTDNFNIFRYYDAIYYACLHSFDLSTARGNEVIHPFTAGFGTDKDTANVLIVVRPPWCKGCLERRKALLTESLARRLLKIDRFAKHEAVRRKERAYVCGVLRGRVHALASPLEDNEWLGSTELEGGVAELSDMLFEVRLASTEVDEELSTIMRRYTIDDVACGA